MPKKYSVEIKGAQGAYYHDTCERLGFMDARIISVYETHA